MARAWTAPVAIASVALVAGPTQEADGGLAAVYDNATSGVVSRWAGPAGERWTLAHHVQGPARNSLNAPLAFQAFAHSGPRFAAVGVRFDASVITHRLVVVASTPDASGPVVEDSGLEAAPRSAAVRWNADGSLSVVWIASSGGFSGGARLNLRRWHPVSGWGPVVLLDSGFNLGGLQLTTVADGRALVSYGRSNQFELVSPDFVRVLWLDANGTVDGAPLALDPSGGGLSKTTQVVRQGNGVRVSWVSVDAEDRQCIASRVWSAGSWGTRSCTDAASGLRTGTPWHIVGQSQGGALAMWYEAGFRVAHAPPGGGWAPAQLVGAPTTDSSYRLLAATVCPSGASFVAWSTTMATASGSVRVLLGSYRNAAGQHSGSVELARGIQRPAALQVAADDDCNVTVAWAQGAATGVGDDVVVRRWTPVGRVLEDAVTIAPGVLFPTLSPGLQLVEMGYLRLGVDARGRAAVFWTDARDGLTRLRLYE